MSTSTTRLNLTKPASGEFVDVTTLDTNFDLIDAAVAATVGVATAKPASAFSGRIWYESDTGRLKVNSASAATDVAVWSVPAASGAAGIVYVDNYVTNVTNATSGINNAIAAASAGWTLVFGAQRYTTAGGHVINKPLRILGPTGRGQTFNQSAQLYLSASANADMLTFGASAADIVVKDLSLYGNRANQTASTSRGIVFSASAGNYCEFDSVWVDSFSGDGWSLSSSSGTISGTIVNSESRLNGRFGMVFTGTATDFLVQTCYVDQNDWSGVDIQAGDVALDNVHIWGNGASAGATDRDGITFHSAGGCRVENCYVETNAAKGLNYKTGQNWGHIATGNHIWANGTNGIYAFGASGGNFSDNIIFSNNTSGAAGSAGAGMLIDTCSTLNIKDNNFYDRNATKKQSYGFYEFGSNNTDIRFEGNISRSVDHASGGVWLGSGTLADLGSYFRHKTADESVTSSVVLQDDDDLQFPVAAGEKWELEGMLFCDGAQAGDINIRIATPTGITGYWQPMGPRGAATSTSAESYMPQGKLFNTTEQIGLLGAGVIVPIQLNGLLMVGATAGTLVVRWCQAVSDGTATIVKAGSYLRARRIAA